MPVASAMPNVVTTGGQLSALVDEYLQHEAFCFDLETTGDYRLNPRRNVVEVMALATDGRHDVVPMAFTNGTLDWIEYPYTAMGKLRQTQAKAAGVDFKPRKSDFSVDAKKATYHWHAPPTHLDRATAFAILEPLLMSDRTKVGHNLKFDLSSVHKYLGHRFPPPPYADTMVAAYLVNSGWRWEDKANPGTPYSLKAVSMRETGYSMAKGVGENISLHPWDSVMRYAGLDAKYTWLSWRMLRRKLKRDDLLPVMELEMQVLSVLLEMELTGAPIDQQELRALDERLMNPRSGLLSRAEARCHVVAGHKFQITSPAVKVKLLYGPKEEGGQGLKPLAYTAGGTVPNKKTGLPTPRNPSVSADALEPYRKRNKLVAALLEHSDLAKLHSTYVGPYLNGSKVRGVEGMQPLVVDGRIHADFNQIGAASGRFSCRAPNLQNCYSADTQVLTEDGWVLFPDLQPSDKVAQWSNGDISFVAPTGYVDRAYTGSMVRLKAEYMDLLVTPEHNIVSAHRRTNVKTISFEPAAKWLAQWGGRDVIVDRKLFRGGNRIGGIQLTAEERHSLQLAVMVQADGHQHKAGWYAVTCVSDRKRAQMEELLGDRVRSGTDRSRVRIEFSEVERWLDASFAKNFRPAPILSLSFDDLTLFLDEVMRWDGDFTQLHTYMQRDPRLLSVEVVQTAACLTGKSTSWYWHPGGGATANVHRSYERHASRVAVTEQPYSGRIYCVTVPSGAILVRRDNDIMVCGNCPNVSTPMGKAIRGLFTAPPGHQLVVADFSQIELRVLAHLCGDPTMMRAFLEGQDIHQATADALGVSRAVGKAINFALVFSAGPDKVADMATTDSHRVTPAQAKKFMRLYDERFPGINKWKRQVVNECRRADPPCVRTISGRVRYLPDILHPEQWIRAGAERQASNTPVQGSAADIIKIAMVRAHQMLPEGCHLILTVHDELVTIAPDDLAEKAALVIGDAMTGAYQLRVPIPADITIVKRWSDAKS